MRTATQGGGASLRPSSRAVFSGISCPVRPAPWPLAKNMPKVDRNDPCPCGSGLKYKKCHWARDQGDRLRPMKTRERRRAQRALSDIMLRDPRFRIWYLVPHPDQNVLDAGPFMLYTPGVLETAHLVERISRWPADIRELSAHPRDKLTFRVLRHIDLRILPIEFSALERFAEHFSVPFAVVVTTAATRDSVSEILGRLDKPVLHVSENPRNGIPSLDDMTPGLLREFGRRALPAYRTPHEDHFHRAAEEVLGYDLDATDFPARCPAYAHGLTAANELALQAFGHAPGVGAPLEGKDRDAFIDALLQSARAVTQARSELLHEGLSHQVLNRYVVSVASPAWVFGRSMPDFHRVRDARERAILRALWANTKRQREFVAQVALPDEVDADDAQLLSWMTHRRAEMRAYVTGLAAFGARDLTPVLRLEPKLNEIRPKLIQIGGCARGHGPHRAFKLQKLFTDLCNSMRDLIDGRVLSVLEEPSPRIEGVKLVADLPLEFIPINGAPLCMKYDCSRVPLTPGSMSFGELLWSRQEVLPLKKFEEILVVRSFDARDPCRPLLEVAIRIAQRKLGTLAAFRFVDVETPAQVIRAVNAFDGAVAIFDCHGHRSDEDHAGTIVIGGTPLHLWQYRKEIRVPPIVLFSACDTYPLDGSHGSSASGMLLVGARTVLGTLLPVDALVEATFIARLAFRIAELLPLLLKNHPEGVNWRLFLTGMLRMAHVSEVLRRMQLEGLLTQEQRDDVQLHANEEINKRNPDWLSSVQGRLSQTVGTDMRGQLNRLTDAMAHVQVGHPESILIVEKLPEHVVGDAIGQAPRTLAVVRGRGR